jgi:hypothetical protein
VRESVPVPYGEKPSDNNMYILVYIVEVSLPDLTKTRRWLIHFKKILGKTSGVTRPKAWPHIPKGKKLIDFFCRKKACKGDQTGKVCSPSLILCSKIFWVSLNATKTLKITR